MGSRCGCVPTTSKSLSSYLVCGGGCGAVRGSESLLRSLYVFVSLGVKGGVGCAKNRVAAVAFDEYYGWMRQTVHAEHEKIGKGDANVKGRPSFRLRPMSLRQARQIAWIKLLDPRSGAYFTSIGVLSHLVK